MPEVRIADRRIGVGQASRGLLSGEVHFWRLDPSVWPVVLARVRELGLDVVSTYVCWDFHELAPGEFDFTGASNSRRGLIGFLDLAARLGFWVLLRPGPYIYAEWPNSGIPERAVQWHRLHPRFLDEARVWMAAVVNATREHLATRGGPVVLWQADNEADPWFDVYAAQIGLGSTPGLFQEFLHGHYTHVADLNRAWSTAYADFDAARAMMQPDPTERYLDVCRFRHWYATEVVRWTTLEYRRLGVDVPVYANTYIDTNVQDWTASQHACDLVGPDLYPGAAMADRPDEHRLVLDAGRYARCVAPLAFIPEFESGIWHGWHRHVGTLLATHYELNAFTALQAGVVGWNWYMPVGRDSWYMSPITDLGRSRPELAPTFAEIIRVVRKLEPWSLEHGSATYVSYNALERGARLDGQADLVEHALYAADIDYSFVDLDRDVPAVPLLVYAGGACVSPGQLRRLQAYVEAGGTLVLFQPPRFEGLTRLALRVASAEAPQRIRLQLGADHVELSSPAVYVYEADQTIVAERVAPLPPTQEGGHAHVRLPIGERMCAGYLEQRGRGRVVVLGVSPEPHLLLALHAWLGAPIACHAVDAPAVHSALFRRTAGEDRYVILTNTAADACHVVLELKAPAENAEDLRTHTACHVFGNRLLARVPGHSGTAIRLT